MSYITLGFLACGLMFLWLVGKLIDGIAVYFLLSAAVAGVIVWSTIDLCKP